MRELPPGWVKVPLSRILRRIVGGGTPSKTNAAFFGGSIPFMTVKDLHGRFPSDTIDHISQEAIDNSATSLVPADTLIVATRMSLGKIVRPTVRVAINQDLKALILAEEINKGYVEYFWRSKVNHIQSLGTGTTVKGIRLEDIRQLELPLAPILEQKRIADKLDVILGKMDGCRERLERIPALLKCFRQSILSAATSGQLTEDWHEEKSAAEWTTVQLGEVATGFSYGSATKSAKAGKVPVLRMGNIQDARLDWEDLVFTSDPDEIAKYRLTDGDVLFNRTNSPELVGKTAIFRGTREAIYAGYLIKVRCTESLLPDYLNYCLSSPNGRNYCWRVKSDGVSQSNINAQKLRAFEFALPSLEEQKEIVRRIETLFAFTGQLEARYTTACSEIERLAPSLISKAFRGELVPLDTKDESADKLLARILSSTVEADSKKRTPRKPRMKQLSTDDILQIIEEMPRKRFSFDDLRGNVTTDYEPLKSALYILLSGANPKLKQIFDEQLQYMIFEKA